MPKQQPQPIEENEIPGGTVANPEVEDRRYAGTDPGVIPESRVFGGGGDRIAALAGLHVAGLPIEEWCEDKSDFEIGRMSFAFTDEGLEQQRKADAARARRSAGSGREGGDEEEKWLIERGDQRIAEGFDPGYAKDYRKELADKYVGPGFAPKFLAEKALHNGRDPRGYEIVKDENGEPVRDRTSILGQIPEEKALKRRSVFQAQHNALQRQSAAKTSGTGRGRKSRDGTAVMEHGESLAPAVPDRRIGDDI